MNNEKLIVKLKDGSLRIENSIKFSKYMPTPMLF